MKIYSDNAYEKAARVAPVLVYFARMGHTLTYGDLGKITGDHHRSFKPAFGLIHQWIEIFAKRRSEDPLPLATIVVQQDKATPGLGAIKWRLEANGLSSDVAQSVIEALFKDEHRRIFNYQAWEELLEDHDLPTYVPVKKSIDEITSELIGRQGAGTAESPAHLRLKLFISQNPEAASLDSDCKLIQTEYIFPSLDRVDVMFQKSDTLYAVEVKTDDADDAELVRGMYQVVKYQALGKALQLDRNYPPSVHACLAISGALTQELRDRARLLNVRVIEGLGVPKSFMP